jgi:hypothetical protein
MTVMLIVMVARINDRHHPILKPVFSVEIIQISDPIALDRNPQ